MIKNCLIDLDGTLVSFVEGICKVHNRPDPYLDPKNHGKVDVDKIWGMKADYFWQPCSEHFWETLPKLADADIIVQLIEEFAEKKKAKIAVCTKASNNYGCLEGKKRWIDRHFPQFSKRFWVGKGCKSMFASPQSLLIDDFEKNTKAFEEAGGRTILLPRPWNLHSGLDAVECLREGLEKFEAGCGP